MNIPRQLWRTVLICQIFLKLGYTMKVVCEGVLEVDGGPVVHMGSGLTVLCRSQHERCGRNFSIYLNQRPQKPPQILNCSSVRLTIPSIMSPKFHLVCKVGHRGSRVRTVCGRDLLSGYPPDKPTGLKCIAPRNSQYATCSWEKGKETYVPTSYLMIFENKNESHYFYSNNTNHLLVPWSTLRQQEGFRVQIEALNVLGKSTSDWFLLLTKDIEIPSTPVILGVNFTNGSHMAQLQWDSLELSDTYRVTVRLRLSRDNTTLWEDRNVTEPRPGVVFLDSLHPLTRYKFQIQICTTGESPKCSLWSPAVLQTTPATAPTKQLDVWRIIGSSQENGLHNVTVLWKPLTCKDYRGPVLFYQVKYKESSQGQMRDIKCGSDVTQCSLLLPLTVDILLINVVTPVGESPPARLNLAWADVPAPQMNCQALADGSRVLIRWKMDNAHAGEVLWYTIQWQDNTFNTWWERVTPEQRSTYITSLKAGVRYNVSLHAVTSSGTCVPATTQVYSREQLPVTGPKLSIQTMVGSRILIQWEELELPQRRGFITSYTVYVWECGAGHTLQNMTYSSTKPRHVWLYNLTTRVEICVSATNSAGEGPVGKGVIHDPQVYPKDLSLRSARDPYQGMQDDGLQIKVCLAILIPMLIVANLIYWNCARRRFRTACRILGPRWLFEQFPKVENSNATKLLQEKERIDSDSSWSSAYSDPCITSVEELTTSERGSRYSSLHEEDTTAVSASRLFLEEDFGYKPQTSSIVPLEEFPEQEDNPDLMDTTCGPDLCHFLRRWPWNGSQSTFSPGPLTGPMSVVMGDSGDQKEDIFLVKTLLPSHVLQSLMGIPLEPRWSLTYFPQEGQESEMMDTQNSLRTGYNAVISPNGDEGTNCP